MCVCVTEGDRKKRLSNYLSHSYLVKPVKIYSSPTKCIEIQM